MTDPARYDQALTDVFGGVPTGHPRTDPGDGRTECPTCGKFVFESIHSCKRVPVTEAAWARWREMHQGTGC